ncbi:MAG: ABC transporter ATP-binding protein [Candidatus Ranarchaeia archaeon]
MGTKSRLLTYVLTKKWFFIGAVIFELFSSYLNSYIPYITRISIDKGIIAGNLGILIQSIILMVAAAGSAGIFGFWRRYLGMNNAHNAIRRIRNELYYSLEYKDQNFYDQRKAGSLLAKMIGDTNQIRMFIGMGLLMLLKSIFTLIFSIWFMYNLSVTLTLWALSIFPIALLIVSMFSKQIGPIFKNVRESFSKLSTVLQENVQGVREVRVFGSRESEEEKFTKSNNKFLKDNVEAIKLRGAFFPSLEIILTLGTIIILWQGGLLYINGIIKFGVIVAFTGYIGLFFIPIRTFGMFLFFTKNAEAAGNRIFEIMDIPNGITEIEKPIVVDQIDGRIEFKDVSFSYKNQKVLENLNFSVEAGEKVAVVGLTGSGKSTLIKLIPRIYDSSSGKITIDGNDIKELQLYSLRKNIGMVSQSPFLFNYSLKDNISFGKPDADLDEIIEVAKIAQIHDYIETLEKKYDTSVGERGVSLSGGQKQRITIARAILPDPNIIILDDATSSVDFETEEKIHHAIFEKLKEKTVFIITQRLSILKKMDKILVLHNHRIVEQGTHDHLIKHKEVYSSIYNALEKYQTTGIVTKIPSEITNTTKNSGGN